MITYSELYHLNLSNLKWAADEFLAVKRLFKGLDETCGTDVVKPFDRAGWVSADPTSVVARAQVAVMEQEYGAALQEAKSVHSVLSDAHEGLKKYQDRLKDLVDVEAKENGLVVDGLGQVTAAEPHSAAAGAEQDTETAATKQERKVADFQSRITNLLDDASDAEETFARVLRSAVRGEKGEAFNHKAQTVDAFEANRASALLKKLDRNDKLSGEDRVELQQIMERNQRDPEFSRMTLDKLGPDRTLLIADELAQARTDRENNFRSERQQYAAIERSLANSVGAANKDAEFSRRWRAQMKKRGTDQLGDDSYNSDGYQALAGLLARGSDPYPEHMTTGLMDDMIAAEKNDPGLWDGHQTVLPGGEADPQRVSDPVDQMLKAMSRNPDAATSYLDPDGGHPDRLEYLLDDRDWPNIDIREQTLGGDFTGEGEADATNTRAGLGLAIEAATRGDEPGSPIDRGEHTEAQARILRDTVHRLDDGGPQNESIHATMRQPLANALADYTTDTHTILVNVDSDYKREAGEGHDGVFTDDEGAHAAPNSYALTRVMRGIAEDPEAYGTMHRAETAFISEQMDALPHDATADDTRDSIRKGSSALGAYDAIRDDVTYDQRDNENSETDWNAKVGYHLVGAPVTAIPVVGDSAQRMVDAWTADMANNIKAENNAEAAAEVADRSLRSQNQMGFLLEEWARQRGIDPDSPDVDQVEMDMKNDRNSGRDNAKVALGRD